MLPSWIIEELARERREREEREERDRARLWIEEPAGGPMPERPAPQPEPVASTVIVLDIL
jgi:hypothetical protein